MKTKLILHTILGMLLTTATFMSCDEHDPIDTDIRGKSVQGYILCSDGRIIQERDFNPDYNTPVGVVFAEKTENHPLLVVMLQEYQATFADTMMVQNTSCSETEFDGYTNTVALQSTKIARDSLIVKDNKADRRNWYTSSLGLLACNSHWFLQSDYVPSVAEMELLFLAKDKINPIIERCGGAPISNTAENAACWYWTSTEVKENQTNQSWVFSMADGSRHKAPKTNTYKVRLIVEYNSLSQTK